MYKIRYIVLGVLLFCLLSCKAQTPASVMPNIKVFTDTAKTKTFSVEYIMGKFDPSSHPDFVAIPSIYRDEEIRYIRKDVLEAFIKMSDAATLEDVHLIIKSATRNFDNQKRIWENKWKGKTILEDGTNAAIDIKDDIIRAKKILLYSSMPGTSRHHWGTDMDFNSFNNEWFEKVDGLKVYNWLQKHAHKYGFCQPYSKIGTDRNTGYQEEKWHWTYTPISNIITNQVKTTFKNHMITGFLGDTTASEIDILTNYMLGISPTCTMSRPK